MTKLVAISLAIFALAIAQPAFAQDGQVMDGPDFSDLPAGTLSDTSLSDNGKSVLADLRKLDPELGRKIEKKLKRTPSLRDRYVYLTKQVNKLDERIDASELNYKKGSLDKNQVTANIKIRSRLDSLRGDYGYLYIKLLQGKDKAEATEHEARLYKTFRKYRKAYEELRTARRNKFGLHKEVGKTEPDKKKAEDKPKKPGEKKTKKVSSCDGVQGETNCVEGIVVGNIAPADDWDGPARSSVAFADRVVEFSVGSPKPTKGGFDPANVLGAPDWDGDDDGPTYTTLGCGGTLVVQFSGEPVNRPGPDFRVYEIGPNVEPYSVDISSDGQTWHSLGTATQTGDFDIAGAAPEGRAYSFLRITDLQQKCGAGWPGADIDAIEALATNELTDHRDLSGAWAARFNWKNTGWVSGMTVCLRQEGDNVTGSYVWAGGTRQGTLEGGVLGGNRLEYEYAGSDCTGTGFFPITQGSPSMMGTYYCGSEAGLWELTRTGEACGFEAENGRPEPISVEIVKPDSLDRIEAKEGETIEAVARGKADRVRVVAPPKPRYDLSVLDDEE